MKRIFSLFVLLALWPSAVLAEQVVPIEDFFIDPVARAPELSPSGRYLSVVREQDDFYSVGIADLSGREAQQLIPIGKDAHVLWLEWASDDRLLVGVLAIAYSKNRKVIRSFASRTLAFNRDGSGALLLFDGERRILTKNRFTSHISSVLPDDPQNVLIPLWQNGRVKLYKINIYTGEYDLVSEGSAHTLRWFVDDAGIPQIRVDTDRHETMLYFYKFDKTEQIWTEYKRIDTREEEEPDYWPIAPGPEENQFYVIALPEGEDRTAIYLYDTENETYLEKVYSHPEVDIEGALVSYGSKELVGATFYKDRLGLMSNRPDVTEPFEHANAFFGNESNVRYTNMSKNGDRAILYVSGPKRPGEYYLYDLPSRQISKMNSRWPNLSASQLGRMEIVHFTARDGLAETAYVTHPVGRENVSAPTIILPHGGPEARDYYDFDSMVQFLASRGYRVVQPNFRGSGGFGRKFAEAGYKEWGGKMQDDLEDVTNLMISKGLATKGNICIAGASYGGYASLAAVQRNSGLFNCAISVSGISQLLEFMEYVEDRLGEDSDTYQYWLKVIGDPETERSRLFAWSPASNASGMEIPVLLIHGEDDTRVPIDQSELMEGALKRLKKPVRFVKIEEEGHSYWDNENEMKFFQEMETFFAKHLTGQF
ncbi:MAG: S9 family peptidase [Alphaproteobacteria bacterium]|nr:MAG: S9 family peptidase [Alphaproteobacteria bacterium]